MNNERVITLPFEEIVLEPHKTRDVWMQCPTHLTIERLVLPSEAIGHLRFDRFLCGMEIISSEIDLESFVRLEGPSVFGAFNAFAGQVLMLSIENKTNEERRLSGAFVRGKRLEGQFVTQQRIEALRDRGRALLALEDTRVYARGWLEAIKELGFPDPDHTPGYWGGRTEEG